MLNNCLLICFVLLISLFEQISALEECDHLLMHEADVASNISLFWEKDAFVDHDTMYNHLIVKYSCTKNSNNVNLSVYNSNTTPNNLDIKSSIFIHNYSTKPSDPWWMYYGFALIDLTLFMFAPGNAYDEVWKYSLITNTFDDVIKMDTGATMGHDYCVAYDPIRKLIYTAGGVDSNGDLISASRFVRAFNVTSGEFLKVDDNTTSDSIGISRAYGGCIYDKNEDILYYFGGQGMYGNILDTVVMCNIGGLDFSVDCGFNLQGICHPASSNLKTKRAEFGLVLNKMQNQVLLIGGKTTNGFYLKTDEIWQLGSGEENHKPTQNLPDFIETGFTNPQMRRYLLSVNPNKTSTVNASTKAKMINSNYSLIDSIDRIGEFDICNDIEYPQRGISHVIYRPQNNALYLFGMQSRSAMIFEYSLSKNNSNGTDFCHQMIDDSSDEYDSQNKNWHQLSNSTAIYPSFFESQFVHSVKQDKIFIFIEGTGVHTISLESLSYEFVSYKSNVTINCNFCATLDDINDLIYIVGGTNCDDTIVNLAPNDQFLYILNVSNGNYSINLASSQPSDYGIKSRFRGACEYIATKNSILIFGGVTSLSDSNTEGSNTVLKYDINSNLWQESVDLLPSSDQVWSMFASSLVIKRNGTNEVLLFGTLTDSYGLFGIVSYNIDTEESKVLDNIQLPTQVVVPSSTLFYDTRYQQMRIIISARYSRLSSTANFTKNKDVISSFAYPQDTYTQYVATNDVLQGIIEDTDDTVLIECADLMFETEMETDLSLGISNTFLSYFNLTQYNDTRYLCILGGDHEQQGTQFSDKIYCRQITNNTCDHSAISQDESKWTELDVKLDEPIGSFGHKDHITIENAHSTYIFNPYTLEYETEAWDDEGIFVSQNYILKYDFIKNELKYIDNQQRFGINVGSSVDGWSPCVCYNSKSRRYDDIIFVLGYTNSTQPNRFLHAFNITTDEYLTDYELDMLGIEYNLPNDLDHPRIGGTCEYIVSNNNNSDVDAIYYIGGGSIMSGSIDGYTKSMLVYNIVTAQWLKWDGILDDRFGAPSIEYDGMIYLFGGYGGNEFVWKDSILVYNSLNNVSYVSQVALAYPLTLMSITIVVDSTGRAIIVTIGGIDTDNGINNQINQCFVSYWFNFISNSNHIDIDINVEDLITQILGNPIWFTFTLIVFSFMFLSVFLAWIHTNSHILNEIWYFGKRRTDSAKTIWLLLYFWQLFDIFTDINVCYTMSLFFGKYHRESTNDKKYNDKQLQNLTALMSVYLSLAVASAVSIIVPFICNLRLSFKLKSKLVEFAPFNTHARNYASDSSSARYFALLIFSGGNFYTTLKLINSGVFGAKFFRMGLVESELKRFLQYKIIFTTLLENIPQIIIVAIFIAVSGSGLNVAVLFSLFGSIGSALVAVVEFVNYCQYTDVEINWFLQFSFNQESKLTNTTEFDVKLKKMRLRHNKFSRKIAGYVDMPKKHIQIRRIHVAGRKVKVYGLFTQSVPTGNIAKQIQVTRNSSSSIASTIISSTRYQPSNVEASKNKAASVSTGIEYLEYLCKWDLTSGWCNCKKSIVSAHQSELTIEQYKEIESDVDILYYAQNFKALFSDKAQQIKRMIYDLYFQHKDEHTINPDDYWSQITSAQLHFFYKHFKNDPCVAQYPTHDHQQQTNTANVNLAISGVGDRDEDTCDQLTMESESKYDKNDTVEIIFENESGNSTIAITRNESSHKPEISLKKSCSKSPIDRSNANTSLKYSLNTSGKTLKITRLPVSQHSLQHTTASTPTITRVNRNHIP